MELKEYQKKTMAVLRAFFEEARLAGPKAAYERIVREPEQAKRLGRYADEYRPLEGLPNVPYVCLRLPTGGGKTILGAHSVEVIKKAWIEKDFPVVLWLVPSNTIRLQTVDALKNARHPYRRVLDEAFDGRVRVFDIADFATVRPHEIGTNLCVVVGTIQTLRVGNTEGRKVYAHHEDMAPHFSSVPRNMPELDLLPDGSPKFSFANLLYIHRPLMVVDEAHNAVTGLTREMQQRVNPCAIVEFTATPRLASNTLHSVTAQELKAAEMIKLPIMLSEHDSWQNAVNGAVATRAALEEAARGETEYIRPIVLFQAQPKNQEVTVEVLKRHLIEVENIPENRIAVATGDQRELDGLNLFDENCPIEYVITVEALKEGWDCSFAYVFCSVSNIRSATDVEQLLGRVLRMPYARRRKAPELNKAYAHVSETSFQQAAQALCDKLVSMGFEEDEALESIESAQRRFDDFEEGLFAPKDRQKPIFVHSFKASSEAVETLKGHASVKVETTPAGEVKVVIEGRLAPEVEEVITYSMPESARGEFKEAVKRYRLETKDRLSPAEHGERFSVPRLMADVQGELEFADVDLFMEAFPWSVLDMPARLEPSEFDVRETARSFEIDLDGKKVVYSFASEDEQLPLDIDVEGWTEEALTLWLDRQVRQPDISQSELVRWLRDVVTNLTKVRKLHLNALMRCKFILARKVRDKIDALRMAARAGAYQQFLFAPEAKVGATFDHAFEFRSGMYADVRRYHGRLKFRKHFLGPENVPAFDGKAGGEEEICAGVIDSIAEVKYWVRNVSQHKDSFYLPTATDRFYPDFIALLEDGRLLVVEYKGELTAGTDDTREKRAVGLLWERASGGKGLFLLAEKDVGGLDVRGQIKLKVGK
ncbi:MAG: DEAD/DEAH box helicase family protein [Magnetospirillum sp.]|nr:DEAD/DEAH box helicase family protein [Magnetospirillum sp.]